MVGGEGGGGRYADRIFIKAHTSWTKASADYVCIFRGHFDSAIIAHTFLESFSRIIGFAFQPQSVSSAPLRVRECIYVLIQNYRDVPRGFSQRWGRYMGNEST